MLTAPLKNPCVILILTSQAIPECLPGFQLLSRSLIKIYSRRILTRFNLFSPTIFIASGIFFSYEILGLDPKKLKMIKDKVLLKVRPTVLKVRLGMKAATIVGRPLLSWHCR